MLIKITEEMSGYAKLQDRTWTPVLLLLTACSSSSDSMARRGWVQANHGWETHGTSPGEKPVSLTRVPSMPCWVAANLDMSQHDAGTRPLVAWVFLSSLKNWIDTKQ